MFYSHPKKILFFSGLTRGIVSGGPNLGMAERRKKIRERGAERVMGTRRPKENSGLAPETTMSTMRR